LLDRAIGFGAGIGGQGKAYFDLQTALRAIAGFDRPTVQAHCALGNRQPQAHSTRLPAAGIVNAIKRTKEFVQRVLGNARTGVHDADDGVGSAIA